jgi:hypothetical protein
MQQRTGDRVHPAGTFRALLWISVAVAMTAGGLFWAVPAHAATVINVTTTTDSNDGSTYECPAVTKPCTLRLAVDAANNTTAATINVPAGTYTLTMHQELPIRTAMTIVGAAANTTIIDGDDTNANNRIFSILPNPIDVSIRSLTLQHARCDCGGGALNNQSGGTVTLTDVAVVNNHVFGSSSHAGAGISNGTQGNPHLVINRSYIAGNVTQHGTDTASDDWAEGGGVFNQLGAMLDITNSTITGNSAEGGGGVFNAGVATFLNDTVAANIASLLPNANKGGGGIVDRPETTVTLTNTIVANNTNGDCRKWFDSGTFTSSGHNIDSDGSCFLGGTGDKPNTDPRLAAAALNAPGQTRTMAIDATSPAYNSAGATACPATDQRGVTRPQGTACDIGAFELAVAVPSPTPTPALPRAGIPGSPSPLPGITLVLGLVAVLLTPLAVWMARRGFPDDDRLPR